MTTSVKNFFKKATWTMIDEIEVFSRGGLKISGQVRLFRMKHPAEALGDVTQAAYIFDFGSGQPGLLIAPLSASVYLGGSMMMLPTGIIERMMETIEPDQEMTDTIHEIGNLFCGSLSRIAREDVDYTEQMRLTQVLVPMDSDDAAIPFYDEEAICYTFQAGAESTGLQDWTLCLAEPVLRALFADDSVWDRSLKPAASVEPAGREPVATAPVLAQAPAAPLDAANSLADKAHGAWPSPQPQSATRASPLFQEGVPPNDHAMPPSTPPHPPSNLSALGGMGALATVPAPQKSDDPIARAYGTPFAGLEVMVVDANWLESSNLTRLLSRLGANVVQIREAEQARQRLSRPSVDLIFLELSLRGESGLSLCAQLTRANRTSQIPVFIVSRLSTPENVHQSILAGATYFLVKPVEPEVLVRALRVAAERYSDRGFRVQVA